MEHQAQFKELSLLRAWGVELHLAIVGPSWVRSHLLTRMRAAALHHAKITKEPTALRLAISSTVKLVLGRSPNETFWVEIMDELVAKFRRLEKLCS
jgi:hypothetical protein